eukprot:CAMPEP_0171806512 /NCGR_PEP_ID=MMETSP0991-20121206/75346_1 /TAXON_ID=483369 /ORGANISM="non described non described, Strain CCMP2098" /LENGTH=53 /DNA_ID=CAMNT_0012419281 /DNA_START=37 /DNA_END=195 /DNA_ORIENTATION=-
MSEVSVNPSHRRNVAIKWTKFTPCRTGLTAACVKALPRRYFAPLPARVRVALS